MPTTPTTPAVVLDTDPLAAAARGRLRAVLTTLDPDLRTDLRRVLADPAAAGVTRIIAGAFVAEDQPGGPRCACPLVAVLLSRGELTWAQLTGPTAPWTLVERAPSWSGTLAAFVDAYDHLDDVAVLVARHATSTPAPAPDPTFAVRVLGELLAELEGGER